MWALTQHTLRREEYQMSVMEVQDLNAISNGNVLVDFYTTTCGPCRAMNPVLEEISKEFENVTVAKVEITKNPQASQRYGIMSVPTLMFMQNSRVKAVTRGLQQASDIRKMITSHLNGHGNGAS